MTWSEHHSGCTAWASYLKAKVLLELREAAQEQGNFLLSPPQPPHLLPFWKLLLKAALKVIGYQSSPESEPDTLTDKMWMFETNVEAHGGTATAKPDTELQLSWESKFLLLWSEVRPRQHLVLG